MNIGLPINAAGDVASSTTGVISAFAPVVILGGGVFLGLFVIQVLFEMLGRAYDRRHPQPGAENV